MEMWDQDNVLDDFNESLEQLTIVEDRQIGCANDILRMKMEMRKALRSAPVESTEGLVYVEYIRDVPNYIAKSESNESTIVIDDELLFGLLYEDAQVFARLVRQLNSLKPTDILNVIIETSFQDMSYAAMESGILISNLIRQSKCTKFFNFGSTMTIVGLMIAMCCDEVYVSDFAAVSIVKADDGKTISRYVVPVYRHIVRETYRYWTNAGLFTPKEVANLFQSEADNSIQLLSTEIQERLKPKVAEG